MFQLKSNFIKKIQTLEVTDDLQGGKLSVTAVYKDLNAKPLLEQKSVLKDGEIITDEIRQLQTGEVGRIRVEGETVHFEYEQNGKKKISTEKLKPPFVTTANFSQFMRNNWTKATTTEGLELRYGVWFRLETVGFKIFKVEEKSVAGETWVHLRMKPSSFVIAALVDPIDLWFEVKSMRLMEHVGRVSTKQLVGTAWKDLDAEVRYRY
ncbi:MAG: hypothetical protein EOP04_18810 [Proteobacteria bacterium]|nr:MAG: hypothetical protein EOP04_18810 [Pseudomonadota bacterium]